MSSTPPESAPSDPDDQQGASDCADRTILAGLGREVHDDLSHHVRSPLTVVLGRLEILMEQRHGLPEDVQHSLTVMQSAAHRIAEVGIAICDLFDAAAVGVDTVTAVPLDALIEHQVAALRPEAARRGVVLLSDTQLADGALTKSVVDPDRLGRACRELIDNAVKYTSPGATVRVVGSRSSSGLRVTVSDDGAGLTAADRDRVIRPFERGATAMSTVDGLGMGLTVASTIASAHGGHLTLSERPGGGLTACLEVPDRRRTPRCCDDA